MAAEQQPGDSSVNEKRSSSTDAPGTPSSLKQASNMADDDSPPTIPMAEKSAAKKTAPASAEPTLKNYFRVLKYSTTLERIMIVVGTIASIGAGVALPFMNVVFGGLVGNFVNFSSSSGNSASQFTSNVNQRALYFVYLWIAKFVLGYISIFCFRMSGIRISAALRLAYLKALFALPINTMDKQPSGGAVKTLTTVANTIQMGISDRLAMLIQSIALVVGAYIIAFIYSWQLTLVSSSSLFFTFFIYGIILPTFFKRQKDIEDSETGASGVAGDMLKSIRTVKSLCAESAAKTKYARWVVAGRRAGFRMAPVIAAFFAPGFFAIYANIALTFWFGIKLYTQGHIASITNIIIPLFSVQIVVSAFNLILGSIQVIGKAAVASGDCFKIIDSPRAANTGLMAPDIDANADIHFQNVHFTYPGRPDTEILKGMDLTIAAGKITALVGPSGCGKSTIVALLERWYDLSDTNELLIESHKDESKMTPLEKMEMKQKEKEEKKSMKERKKGRNPAEVEDNVPSTTEQLDTILQNSGSILVGSHNLETVNRRWWRGQIGLVQQEPFLFDDTILNNVAHGLIGSMYESYPESERHVLVEEACREAYADDFIRRLPQGYHTRVGESGIKLSGGQRQRLAIARSIVKKPAILVLDEATSSIDVKAEKIVQAALDQVSKGRTTITVAHRLSTIKKADNIVVLKEGVQVEHGTHDALLADADGVYASLVRAQHLELGADDNEDEARRDADKARLDPDLALERMLTKASSKKDEENGLGSGSDGDDSTPAQRSLLRTVGKLFYEQREHYVLFGIVIFGAVAAGAVFAPQSYFMAQLFTVFGKAPDEMVSSGNYWSLLIFILAIVVCVAYSAIGWGVGMLSSHITTSYRQEYFECMLGKTIAWFDEKDHAAGTLTSRLSYDPRQLQEILGPNMALPLVGLFNVVGSVIIAFCFGWKLALVVAFSALPVITAAALLRVRYELQFESYNANVFSKSSQFAAESVGAFRTVTALTLENVTADRYKALLDDHVHKAFTTARLAVLVFALSDSIEMPCMALAFWYGGRLLASGDYSAMQFFVIYSAIVLGAQNAGQFLAFGTNAAQATAAANRILSIRGEPEISAAEEAEPRADSKGDGGGDDANPGMAVEFRSVGFTYPTRPVPVWRNLSFAVPAGGYVAFVGPSGCGKTTVVSLLSRFYAASSGDILVDGAPLAALPLAAYRRSIALVSQEPTLFDGTVRDNLVLGLPAEPADADIEEACRAAEIHDFITSLDAGYGTSLKAGTHASLSGGQKQRLCIARALLRKPRLLLLDEATSSLDSQSEALVKQAIDRVAERGNVTVLVVAHRLATVQNARMIVVLGEGGSLLQQGTHAELRARKGAYRDMCVGQALDR